MSWFKRGRSEERQDAQQGSAPTLGEAWEMLSVRLGLQVEQSAERSVHAQGSVRGRRVDVKIEGGGDARDALRQLRAPQRQGRATRTWRTELAVECVNPDQITGRVRSYVDVRDPSWDPRNFDVGHCRVVTAEPPTLAERVITPGVRDRLMNVRGDVTIEIATTFVRLSDESTTSLDAGYVAGSVIHQLEGPIQPWPERATVGPPWWIDLLCDLADAIDAPSP